MKNLSPSQLRKKYEGKTFRYNSKYGGPSVENILCRNIVVCETMKLVNMEWTPSPEEVIVVSDKGNSYALEDVEFYN